MSAARKPKTSVWYFVAATFVAALAPVLFGDSPWVIRTSIGVAVLLLVCGAYVWRKERQPRA